MFLDSTDYDYGDMISIAENSLLIQQASHWRASRDSSFPASRIMLPSAAIGARRSFVEPEDYALYRDLLAERCRANGIACRGLLL